MKRLFLLLIGLSILIGACDSGGGAVVFAPTPRPPDLSPQRYQHPSGVFTIDVPRHWATFTQAEPDLAAAAFSPPGSTQPRLTVAVIQLPPDLTETDIAALIEVYQREIRPDASRYQQQSRQAINGETWRLTGLRIDTGGLAQQVNTFVEKQGTTFSVLDVLVTTEDAGLIDLENAINTLRIDPEATLEPAPLTRLTSVDFSRLEAVNVTSWNTDDGVYFVTGEVANQDAGTLRSVPVRVELLAANGQTVLEATDNTMGYGILPGGFAPFSLRFGQGKPAEAVNYRLTVGDANWQAQAVPTIYSTPELTWEDTQSFTPEGDMLIEGTVTNVSDFTAFAPITAVTVFDGRQQVIAAAFTELDTLAPGESAPYSLRVNDMGGEAVNYIIEVQASADG